MNAEEVWLSVEEVRILLGIGERQVRIHLKAEKYLSRQVSAKGAPGGKKYEILLSSLPESAQKQWKKARISQEKDSKSGQEGELAAKRVLLKHTMTEEAERARRQEGMVLAMSLTGKTAARDAAKHTLIGAYKEWLKGQQKALSPSPSPTGRGEIKDGTTLRSEFVVAYNRGEIEIDELTKSIKPRIDPTSLWRWENKLKQGEHLGGKYGQRKGKGMIDVNDEMKKAIVGLLANTPHASAKIVHDFLLAKFEGKAPSKRNVERWVAHWKETHAGLFQANANPDEWKNNNMVAYGSNTADVYRLNQRWALDSSPADVMLQDGRHSLLACVDLFSRRVCILVAKTSKATAIAALLRRCILDWGVPEEIKSDNGQDYRSLHVQRACNLLGIAQNFSQPFSPWEKGNVERIFRTFSHGLLELLPGFLGHNVAEQQEIRARQAFSERLFKKNDVIEVKMTGKQLQEFCDRWTDAIYSHSQHAGIETTPFLKAQECRQAIRRIDDERVLDMLLAQAPGRNGFYKVQKKGLHIDGADYFDSRLSLYPRGTEMQVLYLPNYGDVVVYSQERPDDPLNLHASLPGLRFVCIAKCPERAGMTREEHAEKAVEAKTLQRQDMQGQKKRLKEIVKESGAKDAPEVILQAAEKKASNIIAFTKPAVAHVSQGIEAAQEAIKAQDNEGYHPADPRTFEGHMAILEDLKTRPKTMRVVFSSSFERASWIFEEFMAGRKAELTGEDDEFITQFRTNNPKSIAGLDDSLNWQWMARWEEYQSYRLAIGWPGTRKPKGA